MVAGVLMQKKIVLGARWSFSRRTKLIPGLLQPPWAIGNAGRGPGVGWVAIACAPNQVVLEKRILLAVAVSVL